MQAAVAVAAAAAAASKKEDFDGGAFGSSGTPHSHTQRRTHPIPCEGLRLQRVRREGVGGGVKGAREMTGGSIMNAHKSAPRLRAANGNAPNERAFSLLGSPPPNKELSFLLAACLLPKTPATRTTTTTTTLPACLPCCQPA